MHSIRLLLVLALTGVASVFAQPLVVTTNTILKDLTHQIGGDTVRVESLLPSGTSSQTFEPTEEQVLLLNQARLVVINGAGYEPWLPELEKSSSFDGPVVIASDTAPLLDMDGELHEAVAEDPTKPIIFAAAVEFDPHAWLDPRNVITYIENIRNALANVVDRAERPGLDERAANLIKEVRLLHPYAEKQFEGIRPLERVLVTPHDSLRYFAAAYKFKVVPITGLASGQDIRPALESRLIDTIRSLRPPAVFFESTANVRLLRRLTTETGAKMVTNLYTTDVGPAGSRAATYVGMFRANVDTIVEALRDPNDPRFAPAAKTPAQTTSASSVAPIAPAVPATSTPAAPAAPAAAKK